MMLLEEQSVRKIRDLRQGGDQSLITCFAKRAPCNCMKEKYEEAKKMPKQGKCDGCKQITERRNLQLCACKVDQYCSAKCQRESWAEHKQYCEAIRSGEAEVSFIYSWRWWSNMDCAQETCHDTLQQSSVECNIKIGGGSLGRARLQKGTTWE